MSRPSRVLILGGTAEGRMLATALERRGLAVVSSLAGRLKMPLLPPGEIRIGGFGGPGGLADWLTQHQVAAVVDASHPFAERISASAAAACASANVPLVRLDRPPWAERPGDRWHRVSDLAEAADLVSHLGTRVLLTIGRRGVGAFAATQTCWFMIRCIEQATPPLPPHHQLLLDRGPFSLPGELSLIDRHRIDVLVTRESGGTATEPKLAAARERGLPVVVVNRPPAPRVATVTAVEGALRWIATVPGVRYVRLGCPPSVEAGATRPPERTERRGSAESSR